MLCQRDAEQPLSWGCSTKADAVLHWLPITHNPLECPCTSLPCQASGVWESSGQELCGEPDKQVKTVSLDNSSQALCWFNTGSQCSCKVGQEQWKPLDWGPILHLLPELIFWLSLLLFLHLGIKQTLVMAAKHNCHKHSFVILQHHLQIGNKKPILTGEKHRKKNKNEGLRRASVSSEIMQKMEYRDSLPGGRLPY